MRSASFLLVSTPYLPLKALRRRATVQTSGSQEVPVVLQALCAIFP